MRTLVLATLRRQSRRYLAAVLAVVIGVAFVVVTNALASSARAGLTEGIDAPYRHADAVVTKPSVELASALMAEGADRMSPQAYSMQPVAAGDRLVGEEVLLASVAEHPDLRWQQLTEGRFPRSAGEAVADAATAESRGVATGDRLRVGTGAQALEVSVVGLVEGDSLVDSAPLYLTWPDLSSFADRLLVQSVSVVGDVPALVPGDVAVLTAEEHVDSLLVEINNEVDVVALVVMLFAAVALFVALLVIANTFSILLAQRRRDLALLRCLGASSRQLLRSARVEALVLGVTASALGVAVGGLGGHGLVAVVRAVAEDAPLGPVDLSSTWLLGGLLVGVVATLVASWLSTRQATGVGPLEALRPQAAPSVRTPTGRVRTALALLLLAGGAAVLGLAVAVEDDLVMVAGGGLFFLGILVLGPVLVPAVITLLARLAGPLLGRHGRLAAANAVRNPRRTAATTAALLVGVTLAAAVLTGMATTRTAMTTLMAEQHPVDVALTADRPLPAAVPSRLGVVRGVARAVTVPGVDGTVHGAALTLLAPDRTADTAAVLHDTGLLPAPGTVRLPLEVLPDVAEGDLVTVGAGTGQVTLEVTRGEGWGTAAALVAPATLAELGAGVADRAVWVRAEPDADPERLSGDLTAAAGGVHPEVVSGLAERRWVDLQLDVLTWSVLGLLAIGVLIALVGIANTLGLSVLERTREHALLRALGLTRRGLRRLLATEGMLVALVATLIGTVVGTGFAWVGIQVMVRPAVESAPLTVPWAQLAVSVVVAGLAGLAAAVLPARRAARVAPAAGLGLD